MDTDKRDIYLGFISDSYDKLKRSISAESYKRSGCDLDEDIFHDTILKCCEKMKYSEVTKDQVLNYVFVSYFNNQLRETQYSRNKYRDGKEITEDIGGICCDDVDYYDIIDKMVAEFGEHDTQLFLDWCDGISVRVINESEHTTNFRYKLEKMRKFARDIIK